MPPGLDPMRIPALRLPFLAPFRRRVRPDAAPLTPPRFGLTPEWLLALDADGTRQAWRIRQRWNGERWLQPAKPSADRPCIAVLAAAVPLRRKLQQFPATARARQALLRAAADEFPLPADAIDCGLGLRDGEGYLYALPRDKRAQLQADNPPFLALLVAPAPDLAAPTCLAALEQFERFGPALCLGDGPRLLSRRQLVNGALGALLVLLLGGLALVVAQPRWLEQVLDAELSALERQAGDLPRLLAASDRMAHARIAAEKLANDPAARLPAELAQLFATLPLGHGMRRVEFKENTLRIAGSGPDPGPWLRAAGFADDTIILETLGGSPTWRAEKKL